MQTQHLYGEGSANARRFASNPFPSRPPTTWERCVNPPHSPARRNGESRPPGTDPTRSPSGAARNGERGEPGTPAESADFTGRRGGSSDNKKPTAFAVGVSWLRGMDLNHRPARSPPRCAAGAPSPARGRTPRPWRPIACSLGCASLRPRCRARLQVIRPGGSAKVGDAYPSQPQPTTKAGLASGLCRWLTKRDECTTVLRL